MAGERVAVRYAKSLIDLGTEQNIIEDFHTDMVALKDALQNRDLQVLVKSPIVKADKKMAIFKELFGASFNKVTMSFFGILTNKGREVIIPEIVNAFLDQYKILKNVTAVKLITANELQEGSLAEIKKALLSSDATDKNVEIETEVNPDLIGGFVLQMGDKLYDASVAYKLDQIKRKFTDNKYIKSY